MSKPETPVPIHQVPRQSVAEITRALAEPFDPTEVKFKPGIVSGNRALALAYIDARVIQDRLDEVLGVEGWQDDYECREDGSVICRLRLRLGDEWVTKVDIGGPSEQPDGGDRLKAAFSDSLKRAAVKFGLGRYLYRLPGQWVDYDSHKRTFVRPPSLPALFQAAKKPETPVKGTTPSAPQPVGPNPAPKPVGKPAPRPAAATGPHTLPTNGVEFQRRLYDYDAKLAAQGICQPGELVKRVVEAGVKTGQDADLATWDQAGITLAAEETKAFEAQARQRQPKRKEVA